MAPPTARRQPRLPPAPVSVSSSPACHNDKTPTSGGLDCSSFRPYLRQEESCKRARAACSLAADCCGLFAATRYTSSTPPLPPLRRPRLLPPPPSRPCPRMTLTLGRPGRRRPLALPPPPPSHQGATGGFFDPVTAAMSNGMRLDDSSYKSGGEGAASAWGRRHRRRRRLRRRGRRCLPCACRRGRAAWPPRSRALAAGARIVIEWDEEEGVAAIAAATSSEDDNDFGGGGSGGRRNCVAGRGGGPTFDPCSRGHLSVPSHVSLDEGHPGSVRFTSIRRGSCSASMIPMRIATVCVRRCD